MGITTQTFKLKEIFEEQADINSFVVESVKKFFPDLDDDLIYLASWQLYNHYLNSEVAYDTPDAFKRHFAIACVDYVPQYVSRLKRLREINNLSTDELTNDSIIITNTASNPNERIESPLSEVVDYITEQDSTSQKGNKFELLTNAINRAQASYTQKFLSSFINLFIKVYDSSRYDDYLYIKEEK